MEIKIKINIFKNKKIKIFKKIKKSMYNVYCRVSKSTYTKKLIRGEIMNKKLNKKDYEIYKSFFTDYEEFKYIKKDLEIYDFKRIEEQEVSDWIKSNYALKVENSNEYERRKRRLQQEAIITKLYFK